MSRAIITESKLTAIADAIRAKTGGTADLTVDEMASTTNGLKLIYGYSSGSSELYQYAELPNGYRTKGSSTQRFMCLDKNGNNAVFNPNNSTSFVVCARIRLKQKDSSTRMLFGGSTSGHPIPAQIYFTNTNGIGADCLNASGTYFYGGGINTDVFSTNTWYYVVFFFKDGKSTISVLADDFTELDTDVRTAASWKAETSYGCGFGGAESNNNWRATNIDFDVLNCFIKVDDTVIWGVPNKGVLDYIQGGNNQ